MKKTGMVYLVGAGPGDAGLMTLRGAELLGRADVVIYDALVSSDLLKLVRPDAEVVYGGKRSRDHAIPQDELNALLARKAKEGKTVVRLKGGDPYVFGRGGEEAEELVRSGVPFEVVPGVSSVVAAPSYAGIPLTHRDHCSSFMVLTGHEDPSKDESSIDWATVAKAPGTKVLLMAVERIRKICEALITHGMEKGTPVAMVRWGSTGRQSTLQGTLADIADQVEAKKFTAPAVTVIGDVVRLREKLNWFEQRPLFGKRVVVTRTRKQASQLSRRLQELGAETLEIPTIRIVEPSDKSGLKDALLSLNEYDWLVFTSPNGVTAFFDWFFKGFHDLRDIGGVKIAAVGPATAAKVKEYRLQVDLTPDEFVTSKIAEAFKNYQSIENLRILLMRAEVANRDLPSQLEELGGIVDDVACYKTAPETEDASGAAAVMTESGADWITFTSSSTVEHFHNRFDLPALKNKFPQLKLASIGPETSKALAALNLKPDIEAEPYTIDGLVEALRRDPGLLAT